MTTGLAMAIMFAGKPRVGVVQHLTLHEYRNASRLEDKNVIWVAKHKLGDKRPATLVLDRNLMDR